MTKGGNDVIDKDDLQYVVNLIILGETLIKIYRWGIGFYHKQVNRKKPRKRRSKR